MRNLMNEKLFCCEGLFMTTDFVKICVDGGPLKKMDATELSVLFGEEATKFWGNTIRFAVKYFPKTGDISGELVLNNGQPEQIIFTDKEQLFFFNLMDNYTFRLCKETLKEVGEKLS